MCLEALYKARRLERSWIIRGKRETTAKVPENQQKVAFREHASKSIFDKIVDYTPRDLELPPEECFTAANGDAYNR